MDKVISVRLPEVLAAKVERVAAVDGMTFSELVRAALRAYLAQTVRESAEAIAQDLRPQLEAEGVTEENAAQWFKAQQRGQRSRKDTATSKPKVRNAGGY